MKTFANLLAIICVSALAAGCHQQRYGMFVSYELTETIASPPLDMPELGKRELARAIPGLLADLPQEHRTTGMLAALALNHKAEPIARLVIAKQLTGPPVIVSQPVVQHRGWRHLDPAADGWSRGDAERVHEQLDNSGQALRWTEDEHRISFVMPGGGSDDEVWLSIPLKPGQDAGWSYGNDFGDIDLGALAVWRIEQVVRCRTF